MAQTESLSMGTIDFVTVSRVPWPAHILLSDGEEGDGQPGRSRNYDVHLRYSRVKRRTGHRAPHGWLQPHL